MKKTVSFGVNMNMSIEELKSILKVIRRGEGKSREYWKCWNILNEKYNGEYDQGGIQKGYKSYNINFNYKFMFGYVSGL